jgi:hypothetical protein
VACARDEFVEMNNEPITAGEFQDRLAAICRGADAAFPRKMRDRHIILRSILQLMTALSEYSEQSINAALRQWITHVGSGMDIDHVTLRRYLVDAGYLERSADGTAYRIHLNGRGEVAFDPAIDRVDPIVLVCEARELAAARKREQVQT